MLFLEFVEEFVFKCLKCLCFIVASGYSPRLSLSLGRSDLDEVLDVIVIDVI